MFNKKFILICLFAFFIAVSVVSANDNSTVQLDDNQDVNNDIDISPSKLSTTYASGKDFKVKILDSKTKKPVSDAKVSLKIKNGKKYKKVTIASDKKGVAKYSASYLGIGKHKVVIKCNGKSETSQIKIKKAKVKISAPKVTNYFKQKGLFKVTVKNKKTDNPIKSCKVLIKVFTGDKYKKFTKKTDKNGIVSINTKTFSKSLHKVLISIKSSSKIKKVSAKSSIKIKQKVLPNMYIKVNGKVLKVKLEDNSATQKLVNKLQKSDITLKGEEYGGFEKLADLGFSLPRSDKNIKTSPGDLVLYEGDQVSLFYNSNSWSYTKLGKVVNVNSKELKSILGSGDVTLVFSLKN